jgi:putative component of toxin-antitoxin plasmid stabilization module
MASDDTFTAVVPREVEEDVNYVDWEPDGSQATRIEAARAKIENDGLVTSAKDLKDGLYEKKWGNGLRLYFAVIEKEGGRKTLLLLGSGKGNDQDKAIKKAKDSLKNYRVVTENIKYDSSK